MCVSMCTCVHESVCVQDCEQISISPWLNSIYNFECTLWTWREVWVCVLFQWVYMCEFVKGGVIIYLCFETKSGSLEPRCRRPPPPRIPPFPEREGGAVNSPQITTMLRSCNLFQLLPGLKRTVLFSLSARGGYTRLPLRGVLVRLQLNTKTPDNKISGRTSWY